MSKRGISPLIGTVLLVAIVIAMILLILPWIMRIVKTQQEETSASLKAFDCSAVKLEIKDMTCGEGDSANVLIDNRGVPVDYLIIRTYNKDGSIGRVFPGSSDAFLLFAKTYYKFDELQIKEIAIDNLVKDGKLELLPIINGNLVCSNYAVSKKSKCGVDVLTECIPCDCATETSVGETCVDDCGEICEGTYEPPVCEDTDIASEYSTGRNIYERGTLTFGTISKIDICKQKRIVFGVNYGEVSSCTGTYCYVEEFYCSDDFLSYTPEHIACPGGCSDGICTPVVASVCSDTDITSEYPTGDNIYVKGTLTFEALSSADVCKYKSTGFFGSTYSVVSSCTTSCYVYEAYCSIDFLTYSQALRICSNGCSNGACVL